MDTIARVLPVLEGKQDRVGIVLVSISELWVVLVAVLLVVEDEVAADLARAVGLHGLLLFLLGLGDGLVGLVALDELGTDLLGSGELAILEPWVGDDVWDREALVRVEVEHGSDQVLELLVEEAFRAAVRVSGPELLRSVRGNQLVVRILHVGHVEGWVTSIQDEEDDTKGKEVDDLALVGLLSVDLWGHEAERANDGAVHARAISSLDWAGEAKVDNLDVIESVEQDILALEIAMGEALGVNVVDGLNELLGVVADNLLVEGARVGNIIEELATWHKLANDVGDLDKLTVLLFPGRVLVELEVLYDVAMLKALNRFDLVLEELEGSLVELWVVKAEDLHGILVAIWSSCKFDLGTESRAESLSKRILVNRGSHFDICGLIAFKRFVCVDFNFLLQTVD